MILYSILISMIRKRFTKFILYDLFITKNYTKNIKYTKFVQNYQKNLKIKKNNQKLKK